MRVAVTLALLVGLATWADARPRRRAPPPNPPAHEPPSRVTTDLAEFDALITDLKLSFKRREQPQPQDPIWVARALATLAAVDRALRTVLVDLPYAHHYDDAELAQFRPAEAHRFQLIDGANTGDLAALVSINGWITISEFGEQANRDAGLILLHADLAPDFQNRVLAALPSLIRERDSDRDGFISLLDRTSAIADKIPQPFGTQGRCVGPGQWEPFPIDEPYHLEVRRKLFGMEPMAAYRKRIAATCKHGDPTPVP